MRLFSSSTPNNDKYSVTVTVTVTVLVTVAVLVAVTVTALVLMQGIDVENRIYSKIERISDKIKLPDHIK